MSILCKLGVAIIIILFYNQIVIHIIFSVGYNKKRDTFRTRCTSTYFNLCLHLVIRCFLFGYFFKINANVITINNIIAKIKNVKINAISTFSQMILKYIVPSNHLPQLYKWWRLHLNVSLILIIQYIYFICQIKFYNI